jgi:ribonuclease BN (tRNA processing enzyme)
LSTNSLGSPCESGDEVKLTIVGCSGSYPGPDAPASCYLLEAPYEGRTCRILLDLGSGAFGALQHFVDVRDIDAVLLSHLHADHCLDLCGYYVFRRYHPGGSLPPIPIYGPRGTANRIGRACDVPVEPGLTQRFEFRSWDVSVPEKIGPFEVRLARVDHPVEAYAMRLGHDGRTLVYSGDTGPCPALVALAHRADTLLCEASFVEGERKRPGLHMTGREAAEHARDAGVSRLLLTHLPPWHDPLRVLGEAIRAWDGPIELVTKGATYEI